MRGTLCDKERRDLPDSATNGQKFQKINFHFYQFSVCTSSLSHSNFFQVNSCTRVYKLYTQTAKKSVITDHGKYVKYKTKFNFAIFLILPNYRRVHMSRHDRSIKEYFGLEIIFDLFFLTLKYLIWGSQKWF